MTMVLSRQIPLLSLSPCFAYVLFIEMISCTQTSMSIEGRVGRGAWGRWPAPSAQRPPAKSVPRGPAPRAPGAQGLARVTIPGSLAWPILPRPDQRTGLGCSRIAFRRSAQRSCSIVCLLAHVSASTHAHTAQARDAARDDNWLDQEWCCACVHKQDERTREREWRSALAWDAAHHSLSHAYMFSVSPLQIQYFLLHDFCHK